MQTFVVEFHVDYLRVEDCFRANFMPGRYWRQATIRHCLHVRSGSPSLGFWFVVRGSMGNLGDALCMQYLSFGTLGLHPTYADLAIVKKTGWGAKITDKTLPP